MSLNPHTTQKIIRCLIVIIVLGVAAGWFTWYKFFREEPEPVWASQSERFKYGRHRRRGHAWHSFLYLAGSPPHLSRIRAGPGRLQGIRPCLGRRPRNAGRVHEKSHWFSTRREQLRDLPHWHVAQQGRRNAAHHRGRALAHDRRAEVVEIPHQVRPGPALQRHHLARRNRPRNEALDGRPSPLSVCAHSVHAQRSRQTGKAIKMDEPPRLARLGSWPRRSDEPDEVFHDEHGHGQHDRTGGFSFRVEFENSQRRRALSQLELRHSRRPLGPD